MSHDEHMLSRVDPPKWFVPTLLQYWEDETCQDCGGFFLTGESIGELGEFRGQPQFIHERCYQAAIFNQEENT